MDDVRIGRTLRALRHRLGWRQVDVAMAAGVSQQEVSLVERGRLESTSLRILRAVARAFEMGVELEPRWRGGALDRLLDERHAAIVASVVDVLRDLGWELRAEASYSVYGERGSIDVLAWHAASATLVVVEVKSELVSIEATLRKHDEKVRLASRVAGEREGWTPRAVSRLLVLPDTSTTRRRIASSEAVLATAYPLRGRAVRAWLARPMGAVGSVLLLSDTTGRSARCVPVSARRVRLPGHARGRRPRPPGTIRGSGWQAPGALHYGEW